MLSHTASARETPRLYTEAYNMMLSTHNVFNWNTKFSLPVQGFVVLDYYLCTI
jgi:hypothetical protein